MNTKISKLLGIGLAIATLATLMIGAIPASANDPEVWGAEAGPSSISPGNQIVVTGTDVTDFAVANDGMTIYAVSNAVAVPVSTNYPWTTNNGTWKSTTGGASWSPAKLTTLTGTATLSNPKLVAVAPDDANTVVIIGDDTNAASGFYPNKIVLSSDGGLTFNVLTGSNMSAINDLSISPLSAGVRYIALAGVNGVTGSADVQYLNVGAVVSSWTSMTTGTNPNWAGFTTITGNVTVLTVAFSPNFASDKVMLAVTNNATFGPELEIASFSSNKWNSMAGFANYPRLITGALTVPILTQATFAQIALAPTYLGADETLRAEFISIANGGTGGVFYMKDSGTPIQTVQAGLDFFSVAYNGSDLVAGVKAGTSVYYCPNPTSTTPTVSITTSYQKPGGTSNVRVAWAGTNVVAGTQGINSAFAVSKDKGATFNDVSLVDNRIVNIRDFAVSPDGGTVYSISDDNITSTQLNVWRKSAGTWEKVLSLTLPTGANAANYIVRSAPDVADNVYISNTGAAGSANVDLYYSSDKGEKSWALRSMIDAPKDIAIESAQVVYAVASNGKVYKSVNSGFTWDTGTSTGLTSTATIVSIKKDQLIVGGTAGTIAWSTDGSAAATTWVAKTVIFAGTAGTTIITADKLDTGGFIYVATNTPNQDIRRWKVGTSVAFDDIILGGVQVVNAVNNVAANGGVYSIGIRDGILNILAYDPVNGKSALERVMSPTTADSSTNWSAVSVNNDPAAVAPSGAAVIPLQYFDQYFNRTRAMQFTSDGKVWALNGRMASAGVATAASFSDNLYSILDTSYKTGPAPSIPADASTPATNPVTGRAEDVAFSWPRLFASSVPTNVESMGYQLQIALDNKFTQIILQPIVMPQPQTSDPVVQVVGPYQAAPFLYSFAPGTTYYWRVKMTNPIESAWSATRSFTFSSLAPFKIASPAMGATDVPVNPIINWTAYSGAKWYELTLSQDPSFAIPEWSHNVYNLFYTVSPDETLKFNTTYYFRVRGVTADPYVQGSAVITPAGPYQTGAFTTASQPVTAAPPAVIVSTVTSSAPPTIITLPPVVEKQAQPIPSWMLMTIIVIGAVLIVALIVLIVRTRRVA